jgi:SSS family solute:Na+ symporter
VTRPRPPKELEGLVYGLTKLPHESGVPWYERPAPLAIAVGVLLVLLNVWFW